MGDFLMSSFNEAILVGNLTKDPVYRDLPSGKGGVTTLRLAVNSRRGESEETLYIDAVVFGKQAESCRDYLKKGRSVLVSGRIKSRSYENKEGEMRYVTEIMANTVQFLGGKNDVANTEEVFETETPKEDVAF
tara:strand:+ start:1753 stop:2151 length:399 start_codon:yes stop_codon:yes gene_type:complete